jgi:nucleotide-binding universal stress UspA family protein
VDLRNVAIWHEPRRADVHEHPVPPPGAADDRPGRRRARAGSAGLGGALGPPVGLDPAAAGPGARALLLRPGSPVDRPAERRPHVVAALETLPDDDAVVADAVACAVAVGGALTLVHAVPRSFGERSVGLDGAVAHGLRVLEAAVAHAVALHPALVPATQLLRVRPHELVGEALDADLLVVGGPHSDHRGSVQPGGLGLVAHSALHHAPCPVLVAPR